MRPTTRNELDARPPQYLIDEIDRLLKLEEQSHDELVRYMDLTLDVPEEIFRILSKDAPAEEAQRVLQHRQASTRDGGNKLKRSGAGLPNRPSTETAQQRSATELPTACSARAALRPTEMARHRARTNTSRTPPRALSRTGPELSCHSRSIATLPCVPMSQQWPPRKRLRTKTSAPPASSLSEDSRQRTSGSQNAVCNRDANSSADVADGKDDTPLSAIGIGAAIGIGLAAVAAQAAAHAPEANRDPPLPPPPAPPLDEPVVRQRARSSVPVFCSRFAHACNVSSCHGCPVCGRTCHSNCDSELCEEDPCAFCLSEGLLTPESSALCIAEQRR